MSVAQNQRQEDGIEGLCEALVGDGFTIYCCGSKARPAALVASFGEWDSHVDVVIVPQEGPAAAARLAKSDGLNVLDPPLDAAVWSWVGEPEPAIWALLKLPHPDHPDAPKEVFPTPAALWVPPESRRPTHIRQPPAGKARARADRLRGVELEMSRAFFHNLFDLVDSEAAIGAAENFTEDGVLQFGNFPSLTGRTEIARFITTLFTMVTGVAHQWPDNFRELADGEAFTNGVVTFTRHDLTEVTVPYMTFSQFNADRTLLIRHQVNVCACPALMPATSAPAIQPV